MDPAIPGDNDTDFDGDLLSYLNAPMPTIANPARTQHFITGLLQALELNELPAASLQFSSIGISPGDTMLSANPMTASPPAFPQTTDVYIAESSAAAHRHSSIPTIFVPGPDLTTMTTLNPDGDDASINGAVTPSLLSCAETHQTLLSNVDQPSSSGGGADRESICKTRAHRAQTILQGPVPNCFKIVRFGRDVFLGNICCVQRGLWKDRPFYVRLAKEALNQVFTSEGRADRVRPLDAKVVLELGYSATSEEFIDLLVATVKAFRGRIKRECEKSAEGKSSTAATARGFFLFAPGPDGLKPSTELVAARSKWLADKNRFMHDGSRDDKGNFNENFQQAVGLAVIFHSVYQGSANNSSKRSFAQGIKAYYEEYKMPIYNVPFVSYIPAKMFSYPFTTLRRHIDMFSTGTYVRKDMDGNYQNMYYANSDDLHARLENPAFAAIHTSMSEEKARQFMKGNRDWPEPKPLWREDEIKL